jgi:hypothetical protein
MPTVFDTRPIQQTRVEVRSTGDRPSQAAADRVFALLTAGLRDLPGAHEQAAARGPALGVRPTDMVIACAGPAPLGAVTLILPRGVGPAGRRVALIASCGPGEPTLAAILNRLTRFLGQEVPPADVPVLILDEPGTHLEADAALADLVATAADRTVLLITHREPTPGADALLRGVDEVHTLG